MIRAPTAQPGRDNATGLVRTSLGALLFFASYGILMGAFPAELAARGLGPAHIGMVVGFYAIGAVCFRIFALNAIDRSGAQRIAGFAALCAVFATLLLGASMIWFEAALPLLALAKFVHGAAASAFLTSGYTYVAQAGASDKRGKRIGIYGGIGSFGLLIPPPVGIWLWANGGSAWFWLLPVAIALPTVFLLPGDQRRPDPMVEADTSDRLRILLFCYAVAVPILALAVSAGMQGGFEAHFPLLVEDFGAKSLMAHMYFLFGLSVVAGRVAGGWLVDHGGATKIFFSSLAVQMFAVLLPLTMSTALGLAASATTFGLGSGMLTTSAIALLAGAVPPHRSAAAIGFGGLMKDAGFAAGAAITGLMIAAGGASAFLYSGFAAIALTAAIAAYGNTRKG